MSVNLIGLSGYAGSGKTTTAEIIQYVTAWPNSANKTGENSRSLNSFKMDVGMGLLPDWEIKGFSFKLKQIASILTGIPAWKFEDSEFKKTILSEEWSYDKALHRDDMLQMNKYWETVLMSVREFLQVLGTDAIRDQLHPNAWVNALFADYNEECKWVIGDCRFPNEAKVIKKRGGIIVRVQKGENVELNRELHSSETSLDNWEFDYILDNSGSVDDLIVEVKKMLKHYEVV